MFCCLPALSPHKCDQRLPARRFHEPDTCRPQPHSYHHHHHLTPGVRNCPFPRRCSLVKGYIVSCPVSTGGCGQDGRFFLCVPASSGCFGGLCRGDTDGEAPQNFASPDKSLASRKSTGANYPTPCSIAQRHNCLHHFFRKLAKV